jgi:hypothetical protein
VKSSFETRLGVHLGEQLRESSRHGIGRQRIATGHL